MCACVLSGTVENVLNKCKILVNFNAKYIYKYIHFTLTTQQFDGGMLSTVSVTRIKIFGIGCIVNDTYTLLCTLKANSSSFGFKNWVDASVPVERIAAFQRKETVNHRV